MDPTIDWIDEKFSARPVIAEANKRALKAGYAFGETTEIVPHPLPGQAGQAAAGHVPEHHRQRGDGARLPGRLASWPTGRCSTAATRSPRPATSSTSCRATRPSASRPSRPRTRSPRSARPSARATAARSALTASSGPGHRAQDARRWASRSWSSCRSSSSTSSAPARRPACRPRTSRRTCSRSCSGATATRRCRSSRRRRPASASTWPSRRAGIALKYMTPVVYLSDAFLATGSEPWRIPDVADLPDIGVAERDRPGHVPPVPARPGDAGPAVGRPGHARPRAPHRRAREGRRHRQRQLRPGQPPPDADCCARPRSPASPTTSRRSRSSGRERGDLLILGWGSTYGAIRSAVERLPGRGPVRRPRPPAPPQPVPGQHRRRSCAATAGCSSRRSTWASC